MRVALPGPDAAAPVPKISFTERRIVFRLLDAEESKAEKAAEALKKLLSPSAGACGLTLTITPSCAMGQPVASRSERFASWDACEHRDALGRVRASCWHAFS